VELERAICREQWRRGWLRLLPQLEPCLIEAARLQSEAWQRGIVFPGGGLPFEATPWNRPTTEADVRRVCEFQRALLSGEGNQEAVAKAKSSAVFPSSLRLSWWRGF
jgi:hypothetical protein